MSSIPYFHREYASYSEEINNARSGYEATWCLPLDAAPLVPCGNPMCTKESAGALYCSTYCLETCEEDARNEPAEESEGVQDAPLTETDLDTLLAALCLLTRTQREYLALTLMGPEAYCEAREAYYRAKAEPVRLGHILTASAQYAEDEKNGGLAWLACTRH